MTYCLVARLTARDGEQARAAELVGELVRASRTEPGVVHYVAHRAVDDDRVFLMYEAYRDRDALEAHEASEHLRAIGFDQLFPLMEQRERAFYESFD